MFNFLLDLYRHYLKYTTEIFGNKIDFKKIHNILSIIIDFIDNKTEILFANYKDDKIKKL